MNDLTHTEENYMKMLFDYTMLIEDQEHVMVDDDEELRRVFCWIDLEKVKEISVKFLKIVQQFTTIIQDSESNMRQNMIITIPVFVEQFMRFNKAIDERLTNLVN